MAMQAITKTPILLFDFSAQSEPQCFGQDEEGKDFEVEEVLIIIPPVVIILYSSSYCWCLQKVVFLFLVHECSNEQTAAYERWSNILYV